jgi:hypothetical protein
LNEFIKKFNEYWAFYLRILLLIYGINIIIIVVYYDR